MHFAFTRLKEFHKFLISLNVVEFILNIGLYNLCIQCNCVLKFCTYVLNTKVLVNYDLQQARVCLIHSLIYTIGHVTLVFLKHRLFKFDHINPHD